MATDRIVAVGFFTERDLRALGDRFVRLFPIEHDHEFDELIARLDQIPSGEDATERHFAVRAAMKRAAAQRR